VTQASRRLKLPLLLGAIPLATGISIFLLWLMTGWTPLMFAGLATLYAGFLLVLGGLVVLGVAIVKMIRARAWTPALKRRSALVALLLIVNFPAAGAIIWAVVYLETIYTVTISNHSSSTIEQAAISGGGVSVQLGQIKSGARVTKRFFIEHKGELVLSGIEGGRPLNVVIDGYVTNSGGGHKEVEISPNGSISTK
jgi:hypothetical protein